MNIVRNALLFIVSVAFVWAFVPQALRAQSPAPASSATAATPSPAVDTKNYAYAPSTLTVARGTAVVFKNSDTVAHTITAADKSFDSGNMDPGASWTHAFAKAGTYRYICAYHTYMEGTIVVK